MSDDKLADQLQRLCCAETEGKFFDCVTDNIGKIIAALRRPDAAAADEIERLREENRKLRAALIQQYATTASLLRSEQMPKLTPPTD